MSDAVAYRSGFCSVDRHERRRGTFPGAECACDCHSAAPEPVAVHCFFGCGHVTRHEDPHEAHDAMEYHYRLAHWQRIREIVGWTRGERWAVAEQQA